jgi:hypothetical protein
MNIDQFVDVLKESFSTLTKNYKVLWMGVGADILFFLVYGFASGPFISGILEDLRQIGGQIITKSANLGKDFIGDALNTSYFRNIVILSVILAIIVYFTYCFFHGFIWKFYFRLAEKKGNYFSYMKRFFLVNIWWYLLFVVYVLFDFLSFYIDTAGKNIEPNGIFFLSNISFVFLLIIGYFALISYVLIENNKAWKSIGMSFKIGFKRIHWVFLMYLVIVLAFAIINYLGMLLGKLGYMLLIFFGILIITPMMGLTRVFIKNIVQEL